MPKAVKVGLARTHESDGQLQDVRVGSGTVGTLRLAQVMNKSGLSKASIYRLGKLGRFPLPFRIGIAAVGWNEAEIEFWIFERKFDTIH